VLERFRRWRETRGRFPDDLRRELEAEGIEAIEEQVPLEVMFRAYEVPGQRPRSGHQSGRGSIALTTGRLVVHGTGAISLHVPRGATWLAAANPQPDRLQLAYDASAAHPNRAGQVEMTFETPRAREIHATLQAWMRTSPG
jgi:hypothetical protein